MPTIIDMPAPKVFDEEGFLVRLQGNKKLADRVLTLYLKNSENLIKQALDVIEKKYWKEVSETAHALKGSSLNVGAQRVAKAAYNLEVQAKTFEASLPKMTELFEHCRRELSEACDSILERLKREEDHVH